MRRRDARTLGNVLRLWGTVLAANVVGALAFAFVLAHTQVIDEGTYRALKAAAIEVAPPTFGAGLLRGVFAGWLIAMVVWLLPFAETARVWVIILLTYVVGVAKLSHVVAGAIDAFVVAASGEVGWGKVVGGFLVPALLGNIVGGVLLVAVVNHAQVVAGEEGGADA